MSDFEKRYSAFLKEFGKCKKMVLSTSLNDKVTSRMMSIVQQNGIFYFQTDIHFRKYDQLVKNQNVALCIDNIQIEGIGKELGHPFIKSVFQVHSKDTLLLAMRCYLRSRLCLWNVGYIKEGIPFVETFNIEKKEYCIQEYKSL